MKEKNYTVYIHKNKINTKVYIGITGRSPEVRWGKNGRCYLDTSQNLYFANAINKYGWDNFDHIIICDGLTKKEAQQMEINLIAEYDSTNRNKGYNIQHGGQTIGTMNDESKKKISKANKGRFVGEKNPNYGKPCPENRKQGAIKANSIPVCAYDKNTGEFYNEFSGGAQAGRQLGLSSSSISKVCKGKGNVCGNYIFKHKDDCGANYKDTLSLEELNAHQRTRNRSVVQLTRDGNFVCMFNTIKDAEFFFGKKQGKTLIWHCCNHRKPSALGYVWVYENEYNKK